MADFHKNVQQGYKLFQLIISNLFPEKAVPEKNTGKSG